VKKALPAEAPKPGKFRMPEKNGAAPADETQTAAPAADTSSEA